MPVTIDLARCDGNGECVKACAFAAIEVHDGKAVVFDNCTDCGACVIACTPKAIWSDLFSPRSTASILAVDFGDSSAIASVVELTARSADTTAQWMTVDPSDAGAAADALADAIRSGGFSLIVLPHAGPGPAIAGRTSARLEANVMAACGEIRLDDAGGLRAVRPRYGGVVNVKTRSASGTTVATILPRGVRSISAARVDMPAVDKVAAGEAVDVPVASARRIVAIGSTLAPGAALTARAVATALGALAVEEGAAVGKQLAPDLYVAIGIDGSTEHNAAFRSSRIVVALVEHAEATIAQIADYVLVGDVEEHAKALLAAL